MIASNIHRIDKHVRDIKNGTSRSPHPERTRRWEVGDDTDEVSDDHLPRGDQNPNAPPEAA